MDLLKKMGRRLASSLPGKASHLDVLGEAMYSERDLKGTLSERMIRRYASVPEEDKEAATTNFRSNIFARKQSHSGGDKSKHFKQLSKGLSKEEIETNKKRIASVADLMTVFADENDLSSDQDELIEELQNIGYIITSKGSGNK